MQKTWNSLLQQSHQIAHGAPQVIQKRLTMFHANPWSPAVWMEAQNMILEKCWAGFEAWRTFTAAMLPTTPQMWLAMFSLPQPGRAHHAAIAFDAALKPVSQQVRRNVKRLHKAR